MPAFTRRLSTAALLCALGAAPLAAQATNDPNNAFLKCRAAKEVVFHGSIVDAAVATPALSTLTSLVVAANLAGPLAAPGDLTVFAPTNAAFGKIPPAVLNALGGDIGVLSAVLTYHVVPGKADPRKPWKREVKTLQGQTLVVGYDKDGASVNQSTADCTAVRTNNGTVWVIDSVLLPQFK
ncbi:secreted/surface protein with fasciclin-like repeats [Burkholderiales bacterium JOSHI_001]|nr:secreted/surface protein with fasciclin-like repeats [Burkholderiales bacterium JOSHI_001]